MQDNKEPWMYFPLWCKVMMSVGFITAVAGLILWAITLFWVPLNPAG